METSKLMVLVHERAHLAMLTLDFQ